LLLVRRRDPEATFAMLPADHVIHDSVAFRMDLERAFSAAERMPLLVTIGIKPTDRRLAMATSIAVRRMPASRCSSM
jgi:mannose-1-phosphate guanylyltransferase